MTINILFTNQYEPGLRAAQRALELATSAGDLLSVRRARYAVGQLLWALGNYEGASAHFQRNIEMESQDEAWRWHRFGTGLLSVQDRRWLGQTMAEVGRFAEGIALATEAVEISEKADHPFALITALLGLGFVLLRKGDVEPAIRALERCSQVSQRLNLHAVWPTTAALLAVAYGRAGRGAEASEILAVVRTDPDQIAPSGMLAESCFLAGCTDEARDLAPQELEFARAQKARGREAWVCHLLAELAARSELPEAEAAETHYRQALTLASERGMHPLVAHCHLGIGKLYRRTGKRDQAQEHLTTAITMYREMDMRFWLEQAEAEMGA